MKIKRLLIAIVCGLVAIISADLARQLAGMKSPKIKVYRYREALQKIACLDCEHHFKSCTCWSWHGITKIAQRALDGDE